MSHPISDLSAATGFALEDRARLALQMQQGQLSSALLGLQSPFGAGLGALVGAQQSVFSRGLVNIDTRLPNGFRDESGRRTWVGNRWVDDRECMLCARNEELTRRYRQKCKEAARVAEREIPPVPSPPPKQLSLEAQFEVTLCVLPVLVGLGWWLLLG